MGSLWYVKLYVVSVCILWWSTRVSWTGIHTNLLSYKEWGASHAPPGRSEVTPDETGTNLYHVTEATAQSPPWGVRHVVGDVRSEQGKQTATLLRNGVGQVLVPPVGTSGFTDVIQSITLALEKLYSRVSGFKIHFRGGFSSLVGTYEPWRYLLTPTSLSDVLLLLALLHV